MELFASRFCVSSLRRGHANLLCIIPIVTSAKSEDKAKVERNLAFINPFVSFMIHAFGLWPKLPERQGFSCPGFVRLWTATVGRATD